MQTTKRPVFLDPLKIEVPVTAAASFGHRVSGVLLAIALPFLVGWLAASLHDPAGYERVLDNVRHGGVKFVLIVLGWALAHHMAAGVRHMLFDAGIGTGLSAARGSAVAVHVFAIAVAVVVAGAVL